MLDQSIVRGDGVAFARPPRFIRRREAAEYLKTNYGFGTLKSLSQGALTGDTPAFYKAGRMVLYTHEALDAWALAKIGAPRKSSSEAVAA